MNHDQILNRRQITDGTADAVFQAAIQQHRQDRQTAEDHGQQLIREALEVFTDGEATIDLRDWVKSARAYLERSAHG